MSNSVSRFHQFCIDAQRGWDSKEFNEHRLYRFFKLLACNRFRWENLPDGIESRHIEEALFFHGECAFVDDEHNGVKMKKVLPCSPSGNMNVYGDPVSVQVTGVGYSKLKNIKDVVRILANDDAIPSNIYINYYSDLINNIETTMRANLKQQRRPYIVATSKNHELTHKNIKKKMENEEEFIFIDEELTRGSGDVGINVMNTNAPYLLDNLQNFKNDTVSELLTFLGLNNTNTNKKERLLVDEVNVNNSHILMNLDIEYKNRKKACDEINKMFGTNIKVVKVIDELQANFFGQKENKKEVKNKDDWRL